MPPMSEVVAQVLASPPRTFTKEEAQAMFKRYGVLNDDNTVSEEFREIFVEKKSQNETRK